MGMREEMNQHLHPDTTLHFPSTLPPQQGPSSHQHSVRRSPPNQPPQPPTLANGLTRDPTMMGRVNANGEMLAAQLAAVGASAGSSQSQQQQRPLSTTTAQTLGPSLDVSQSWSSAMTQMQIQHLDHFYRLQPGAQGQQVQSAQRSAQPLSRGPPLHLDSLRSLPSSHSSTGPAPSHTPHLPRHQLAQHYSEELRRQQHEQLLRQQEHLRQQERALAAQREENEREQQQQLERRNSEEYMRRLAEAGAFGPSQPSSSHSPGSHSGHPFFHTQHIQQQQQQHPVFQDGPVHPHHHPQVGVEEGAPYPHGATLELGYPLVDGQADPLDLGLGASPTAGMIKYESSPLLG